MRQLNFFIAWMLCVSPQKEIPIYLFFGWVWGRAGPLLDFSGVGFLRLCACLTTVLWNLLGVLFLGIVMPICLYIDIIYEN